MPFSPIESLRETWVGKCVAVKRPSHYLPSVLYGELIEIERNPMTGAVVVILDTGVEVAITTSTMITDIE